MLRKSVIGNTDVKTDCRPLSSRSEGSLSICRKRSYERRWTSIRLGIWIDVGIFEKSRRLRKARFSFGMLDSSRLVDTRPRPTSPKEGNIARVSRYSLVQRPARDSCLPPPRSEETSRFFLAGGHRCPPDIHLHGRPREA